MNSTEVAIVGTGPYGLSLAAHLRQSGTPFRILGRLMETWRHQMPEGMLLKSDGFASNLSDPRAAFRLREYCAESQLPYHDTCLPVKLSVFSAYGMEFQRRMVPEMEEALLIRMTQDQDGAFRLTLDTGETFAVRRVVLAVGISHYAWTPESLRDLPSPALLHSSQVPCPADYAGKEVAVVGSGASAIDLAGLLREAGAKVTIISRRDALCFHNKPSGKKRSLRERLRAPGSGLGPGWRSRLATEFPHFFRFLPVQKRLELLRVMLGPSAGWPMRERVDGKVPVITNATPQNARICDGRVQITLAMIDGGLARQIEVDHVIAATGYRVDLRRLPFLEETLRDRLQAVEHMPLLSGEFESSVPGLYFIGISSALTFGPMMRFAYGSAYTAKRLNRHLAQHTTQRANTPAQATATA